MRNWQNDTIEQRTGYNLAPSPCSTNRRHGGLAGRRPFRRRPKRPLPILDGTEVFPSIQQKAARLGFGLVQNHAFVDGNKRIGAHVMLVFLALNHIELEYTQQELIDIILSIAAGNCSLEKLTNWIIEHQQ